MRGRMWRRYKQDCYHLRRIKRWSGLYWYKFTDVNKITISKPLWIDVLGLQHISLLRETRTRVWDSRNKRKWGKKGKKHYDYSSDYYTRIKDKVRFRKELREEYGY